MKKNQIRILSKVLDFKSTFARNVLIIVNQHQNSINDLKEHTSPDTARGMSHSYIKLLKLGKSDLASSIEKIELKIDEITEICHNQIIAMNQCADRIQPVLNIFNETQQILKENEIKQIDIMEDIVNDLKKAEHFENLEEKQAESKQEA